MVSELLGIFVTFIIILSLIQEIKIDFMDVLSYYALT